MKRQGTPKTNALANHACGARASRAPAAPSSFDAWRKARPKQKTKSDIHACSPCLK